MKPAIVTDSNSGITQAQARELGIFVLPMPVIIDGTVYYEDVDLTAHQSSRPWTGGRPSPPLSPPRTT